MKRAHSFNAIIHWVILSIKDAKKLFAAIGPFVFFQRALHNPGFMKVLFENGGIILNFQMRHNPGLTNWLLCKRIHLCSQLDK